MKRDENDNYSSSKNIPGGHLLPEANGEIESCKNSMNNDGLRLCNNNNDDDDCKIPTSTQCVWKDGPTNNLPRAASWSRSYYSVYSPLLAECGAGVARHYYYRHMYILHWIRHFTLH